MSGLRKAAASLAVASTLIFVTACGANGAADSKTDLGPGDYAVAKKEDVVNSIVVDGYLAPIKTAGISTTLSVPVKTVHVQVGDRVKKGQLLVTMDTTSIEREINAQTLSAGEPLRMTAATDVHQMVVEASSVLERCLRFLFPDPAAPAPTEPAPTREELEQALAEARAQGYAEAQQAIEQELIRQQAMAQSAPLPDQAALLQQQAMQEQAMQQAMQAEAMQAQAPDTTMLEYQMQEREVFAPMDGVVTKIDAQEGAPAPGALMVVSDTSRFLVKTSVRESDIANVREGNRVTFTTPITGDTKFEGRVRRVAPTAANSEDAAAAARAMQGGQGNKKDSGVTFPVEIEVTGNTKDLRIGGSARVEIITDEARGNLSIPRDAVFDDNKVLVLSRDGDNATEGTIEERTVQTGISNDTEIAVKSGDLKDGDLVIAWPDDYRDRVGETVKVAKSRNGGRGGEPKNSADQKD